MEFTGENANYFIVCTCGTLSKGAAKSGKRVYDRSGPSSFVIALEKIRVARVAAQCQDNVWVLQCVKPPSCARALFNF